MDSLIAGNRKFVARKMLEDPDFFSRLEHQQRPQYLWIGCSDSRVPVSAITDTEPGQVFVHRNIANLVVHTDFNFVSVLSYAIDQLKVNHVVVCGHYGCGGVAAALSGEDLGLLDPWIRNIRDVYRIHSEELNHLSGDARFRRLVELNVQEQVHDLCKNPVVQNAWKNPESRTLHIHGCVYDLADGLLHDLNLRQTGMDKLADIYHT